MEKFKRMKSVSKILIDTVTNSLKAAKSFEKLRKEPLFSKIEAHNLFSSKMAKIMKNPQFALFSMFLFLSKRRNMLYSEWEYYMRRQEPYDVSSERYKLIYTFFYNLPLRRKYE